MTTFLSKYSLKIPVSRLLSFSKRVCLYMRSFRSIKCKMKKRKNAKKERGQLSSYIDRTSLVNKGFIVCQKRELFLAGPARETPGLPTRVANRPIRLTQCCTQFKSPGVKIHCVLYLHHNVAFSFKCMEIPETKSFIPKGFELGTTLS